MSEPTDAASQPAAGQRFAPKSCPGRAARGSPAWSSRNLASRRAVSLAGSHSWTAPKLDGLGSGPSSGLDTGLDTGLSTAPTAPLGPGANVLTKNTFSQAFDKVSPPAGPPPEHAFGGRRAHRPSATVCEPASAAPAGDTKALVQGLLVHQYASYAKDLHDTKLDRSEACSLGDSDRDTELESDTESDDRIFWDNVDEPARFASDHHGFLDTYGRSVSDDASDDGLDHWDLGGRAALHPTPPTALRDAATPPPFHPVKFFDDGVVVLPEKPAWAQRSEEILRLAREQSDLPTWASGLNQNWDVDDLPDEMRLDLERIVDRDFVFLD